MPEIDFSKIKKLPPEKRVRVLQEAEDELRRLIEERKQEIEEAEAMLEEAKRELRVLEEIETPKPKEIVVEKLFRAEADEEAAAAARAREAGREASLEEITAREPIKVNPERLREYWTAERLLGATESIGNYVRQTGVLTAEQQERLRYLNVVREEKEALVTSGGYKPDHEALQQLEMARAIITGYLPREETAAEHYRQR